MGHFIQWVLCLANKMVEGLAKRGAKWLISFLGDCLPVWVIIGSSISIVFVTAFGCSVC